MDVIDEPEEEGDRVPGFDATWSSDEVVSTSRLGAPEQSARAKGRQGPLLRGSRGQPAGLKSADRRGRARCAAMIPLGPGAPVQCCRDQPRDSPVAQEGDRRVLLEEVLRGIAILRFLHPRL